ncbi:MAG TPA: hypothetical protein VML01_07510 [Bryobacterales bacterium]|nr:hypothetical protein [Bryobacterales bacterium]
MKQRTVVQLALAGIFAIGIGSAQTTVTVPDTTQSTTMTAEVSEQARVNVPAAATFTVTNISGSTAASAVSVTIDNVVLATATKQLKVSLQAAAAAFTPPIALATTWAAGDVSWNAATWTSATGAAGTLSDTAYTAVATCAADSAACSTTGLTFTLAPKTTVKRSGNHTLAVTWKFESIGA